MKQQPELSKSGSGVGVTWREQLSAQDGTDLFIKDRRRLCYKDKKYSRSIEAIELVPLCALHLIFVPARPPLLHPPFWGDLESLKGVFRIDKVAKHTRVSRDPVPPVESSSRVSAGIVKIVGMLRAGRDKNLAHQV